MPQIIDDQAGGRAGSRPPVKITVTDVFLLCYAVNSRPSYDNVMLKWQPELRHHCPRTPIVLVGTKLDLRPSNEEHSTMLSWKDGKKLKTRIGAIKYVECSAKIPGDSVNAVFEEAIRAVLKAPKSRPKPDVRTCAIL
ncbi:unnamed protein product [Darwinula stevensoni]|uniref:Uncharacterized protein n=1 Tax=Darwinula stevensoni TaxID=69355 RepID=A0A7R8WXZ6_9CRUS|nr:unnamed protein product [Darwinula stevensoni]CAG0878878.1 unnamed protein product [Darwinula stevensoni]